MASFVLEWADPRVGKLADGIPVRWPETDIHGQPYTQINATTLRIGVDGFVVLGADRGQHVDGVVLMPSPPEPEVPAAPLVPPFPVDEDIPDASA